MFTKRELLNMNCNNKYSAFGFIKNIENDNFNSNDKKLFKLYATNNASLSNGREYIALPSDKILSNSDYLKYNIMK
jgi:hypothetical protein